MCLIRKGATAVVAAVVMDGLSFVLAPGTCAVLQACLSGGVVHPDQVMRRP